jgi:hypothetical protein
MKPNDDLDRHVLIHICKDKTLSYRTRKQPIFNKVAIPVFSVNSNKEARSLLMLVGRQQYTEHPLMPGQPWFKMTLPGSLDYQEHLELSDLEEVAVRLRERYALIRKDDQ